MKDVTIDCREVTDRESLHTLLARELQFPAWYGRNLDALFDMLTSLPGQWILRLAHPQALDVLGDYGRAFAETLQDAARENPHLQIHWIP